MRRTVVVLGLALSVLMVMSASAGMQIGAKAWNSMGTYQHATMGERDTDSVVLGPTLLLDLGDSFLLSAMWLFGEEDWGAGEEYDSQEAEAVLVWALDWLDIGVGVRYTDEEDVANDDKLRRLGPMVYVGTGASFGDSPLGWYAGASWMFADVQDDWDAGEHYNAEAGLSLYLDPFSATVGYRIRDHYDADNDLTYDGVTASLSIAL